jgi:hypothetical protein
MVEELILMSTNLSKVKLAYGCVDFDHGKSESRVPVWDRPGSSY